MTRRRRADFRPHPIVDHLAQLTTADGRTNRQLTEVDGISAEAVRAWTKGRRAPGLDLIAARAETLGHRITLTPMKGPE